MIDKTTNEVLFTFHKEKSKVNPDYVVGKVVKLGSILKENGINPGSFIYLSKRHAKKIENGPSDKKDLFSVTTDNIKAYSRKAF